MAIFVVVVIVCLIVVSVMVAVFLSVVGLAAILSIVLALLIVATLIFLIVKIVSVARGEDEVNIEKSWPKDDPVFKLKIKESNNDEDDGILYK